MSPTRQCTAYLCTTFVANSPHITMTTKLIISWVVRLIAAVIMLQTLYFKFMAAPESVYIFTKLGLEPHGRLGIGVAELIASVLLLVPRSSWLGAGLGLGLMGGALMSHLTVLGIEVQDDGGYLFVLAVVTALCCSIEVFLRRQQIPILRQLLKH